MKNNYIASDPLKAALEVADFLNKPLLVSGEPGTGKTQLAYYIKETKKLDFFRFDTKTTSTASDLFYTYDAISHFRSGIDRPTSIDGNEKYKEKTTRDFIELRAMGLAIASSLGASHPEIQKLKGIKNFDSISINPIGSVVLIDEIDKAPRDFPNDLLNEFENFEFEIKELNLKISSNKSESNSPKIFVLMTSNNERVLPEPFLRRCMYYHIPFPDDAALLNILTTKTDLEKINIDKLKEAIEHFNGLRNLVSQKKPATAELYDWIKVLNMYKLFEMELDFKKQIESKNQKLISSYYSLFKNKQDLDAVLNR